MSNAPFFAGLSKTAARKKAKAILDAQPMYQEFEDQWLADLYAQHHYGCQQYQLRPEKFIKTMHEEFRLSFQVECYFSSIGWKAASYRACFEKPDWRARTIKAFRNATREFMRDYLNRHPVCAECGAPSEEVDHVCPEFAEIVQRAFGLFPESYWEYLHEKNHDWMNEGNYELSADNPALYYIQYVHREDMIDVRALCKSCHVQKTQGDA